MANEFRVNTYQDNWQRNPDIVTYADGSFMIVWESYFNNYDDSDLALTYIAGQRYDASGRPVGGEIVIDAVNGSVSETPSVARLRDGGTVVAFTFDNYDDIFSTDEKIYVKIYNADGSVRQDAFRIDTPATTGDRGAYAPEVVALANGGFRVSWVADVGDRPGTGIAFEEIYSRTFTANGTALTPRDVHDSIRVTEFDQGPPDSVALRGGNTITVWRSESSFPDGTDIDANELRGTLTDGQGRVLRADFSLGVMEGEITSMGNNRGLAYELAPLANGGFVMSHTRYGRDVGFPSDDFNNAVAVRFFDARGNIVRNDRAIFVTDEIIFDTSVTQLATGEIVVVWEQYPDVGPGEDVMGRILSPTGTPISATFRIGFNADDYDSQTSPVVRALAGGGFVVAYESESIDSDNEGIAARIFGRGTAGADRLGVDATGTIAGLAGNDALTGNARANALFGGDGRDSLGGNGADDRLVGGTDADALWGGGGRDTLAGGLGRDVLTGGADADRFVIDSRPAAGQADRIADFGAADILAIENAVFGSLGPAGRFDAADFKRLGQPLDASDWLIYAQATGTLSLDSNGSGAGGRTVIAILDPGHRADRRRHLGHLTRPLTTPPSPSWGRDGARGQPPSRTRNTRSCRRSGSPRPCAGRSCRSSGRSPAAGPAFPRSRPPAPAGRPSAPSPARR